MVARYAAGDYTAAADAYAKVMQVFTLLSSRVAVKALLKGVGLPGGDPRPPRLLLATEDDATRRHRQAGRDRHPRARGPTPDVDVLGSRYRSSRFTSLLPLALPPRHFLRSSSSLRASVEEVMGAVKRETGLTAPVRGPADVVRFIRAALGPRYGSRAAVVVIGLDGANRVTGLAENRQRWSPRSLAVQEMVDLAAELAARAVVLVQLVPNKRDEPSMGDAQSFRSLAGPVRARGRAGPRLVWSCPATAGGRSAGSSPTGPRPTDRCAAIPTERSDL